METKTTTETQLQVERLKKLGFTQAANELEKAVKVANEVAKDSPLKRKLAIAYEHFRFVRPEKIAEYNAKLKAQTIKNGGRFSETYDTVDFMSLSDYGSIPPESVLLALEDAKKFECFDSFEIAYIKQVPDPILFGRIGGCTDRFFVSQWDNDVRIEDILKDNEG